MLIIKSKRTSAAQLAGAIILWYGLAVDVPSGWEVYAPAKNAFIMGAAAGAVDTTATGANAHVHTRNANTDSVANHSHDAGGTTGGPDASVSGLQDIGSPAGVASAGHTHTGIGSTSNAGAHTHTVSSVNSTSHLAPYHRLYWIRSVS